MTAHLRRRAIIYRQTREVRAPRLRAPRPGPAFATVLPLPGQALPRRATWPAALLAALRRIGEVVAQWRERTRSRSQLLRLDDAQLKDIGISRADVDREAMKPFWRS